MSKSEFMLIKRKRLERKENISYNGKTFHLKKEIKYLGVLIDERLRYKAHADYAAEKATKALGALSRLMPNSNKASMEKRKLILSTVLSITSYALPVWSKVLEIKSYAVKIKEIQRKLAGRVIGAYRTVSRDAALVLAGVPPLETEAKRAAKISLFKAREREKFEKGGGVGELPEQIKRKIKNQEEKGKNELYAEWQQQWEQVPKSKWTAKIVRDVVQWTKRKHGNCDYRLTQALTGHGVFGTYLYKIGREYSPKCWSCGDPWDTPEHAKIIEEKKKVEKKIGSKINPHNLTSKMTASKTNWEEIAFYLRKIVAEREKAERAREKAGLKPPRTSKTGKS